MITELYNMICEGQEVRKNLIALRQAIKDEATKRALYHELDGDYTVLYRLLKDEDAKVRKNVALIMGELAVGDFKEKLYEAYLAEEKLFVKADYLTALSGFDYSDLLEAFKERLSTLTTMAVEENSRKHVNDEIRTLSHMCLQMDAPIMHDFNGHHVLSDVILITNRDHREVTLDQIQKGKAKVFNAGVVARTDDLNALLKIRTYDEILFRLKDIQRVAMDPHEAAKALYESDLLSFLKARHKGWPPFYFRIEMKTRMMLDKKSAFAKKMGSELERLSKRELINSTSNYEFEIRLIENREGFFNVLLKLYTLKDNRFSYRKNTIASSIAPDDAALIARLSSPYLKEDPQVLDPFCGVGTMLIERNKCVPTQIMYGVDLYGEAIDLAIENSHLADTDIYFITRDFFDFTHKYAFDEIFTNMPMTIGRKSESEVAGLYERFFDKALTLLAKQAVVIMYTRNPEYVEQYRERTGAYTVREVFTLSKKENAYLYIFEVNQ